MNGDLSDNHQLNLIFRDGIAAVPSKMLQEAADVLEERAVETGLAAPLFVADAIRSILSLMTEHEEYGGIRIGFLLRLDSVLRPLLQEVQRGDPVSATRRAQELRDCVRQAVREYDPRKEYE